MPMSARRPDLIETTPRGLYCPPGDFYIDPWQPVERAVLTHAHADHARPGHARYLAARAGEPVLRARLGEVALDTLDYGETLDLHGVKLSLHPAGHVLGSSQVRVEHRGEVWVVSGDYKLAPDPTCAPFEPLRCEVFVTESTFGLPVFRWRAIAQVLAEIDAWWRANADAGRASVLFAYALGKSQRLLAGLDASTGPIVCHGAIETLNHAYRAAGVELPPTQLVTGIRDKAALARALVLAPPSAQGTPWLKRYGDYADAFASGWMQLRGTRRRRAVDRGFVLSDHADWPGLLHAIDATGARRVRVTHGQVTPLVRWLAEHEFEAAPLASEFEGEHDEGPLPDTEPA